MTARILVVDDLLPNIKLLQAKLENEYYEVITAMSGMEAIKIAKENPPDVILLDVMMPEMNGFETCRILKKNPQTEDIPIVMVTALTDIEDRIQGLNAGADDFLTKPINDLPLFARIRSLVRLKSMTDELKLRDKTGAEFGVFDDEEKAKINNPKNANIMIIDDDVAQAQQISGQLASIGMLVKTFSDPRKAVQASSQENFDLIIVSTQLNADDGLHLCSHLRSQEKTRKTPLLILIEDNDMDLLVKGLDMGINDYLITPIDSNEVIARTKIQVRRKRYQDALRQDQNKTISMSIKDGLTNLYNRRYFDMHIKKMLHSAQKGHKPLSLIMIDIDYFKRINDTYGHMSGDEILRQIPALILKNIRPTDLAARFGGEEFVIIMPNTTLNQAAEAAERIRKSVAADKFIIPCAPGKIHCFISVGISVLVEDDTPETLISRADKALYHVKNTGRNRVAVYCDQ